MAWQTRQPCLHRVDALTNTGEAEAVNDPLDRPDFFLDPCAALIGDRDRRGQITEANMSAAERMQGEVGVNDLVVGVAVEKLRGRSEEHTSELQSLMRSSYAFFVLKKNTNTARTKSMHI